MIKKGLVCCCLLFVPQKTCAVYHKVFSLSSFCQLLLKGCFCWPVIVACGYICLWNTETNFLSHCIGEGVYLFYHSFHFQWSVLFSFALLNQFTDVTSVSSVFELFFGCIIMWFNPDKAWDFALRTGMESNRLPLNLIIHTDCFICAFIHLSYIYAPYTRKLCLKHYTVEQN